ncbi:MAG: ribosome maturation factor RimP [Bacteroidota bacterium]
MAQPIIERNNAFLVDVVVRGERSSKVLEVYVDSDSGISLDQCSNISRELSARLDEADLVQGRYRLDVSSPGLDKPLKMLRQYSRNVGRNCKIFINEAGKRIPLEGVLEHVDEKSVTIREKGKTRDIEFSTIIETYIIPKLK